MAAPMQALRELLLWPAMYATEAASLGLRWPKGLLLYGLPGTGKTSVVHAVARECDAHFTSLSGASVHKAYAGESEKVLREAFNAAASEADTGRPAMVFIDEIDTMCSPRDSRWQQETRLVAQLLTLMDELTQSTLPGRFDREIAVPPPNAQDRRAILLLHSLKFPLDNTVDLAAVAKMCNGYVGADLQALCREAAMSSLSRNERVMPVEMKDFEEAHKKWGLALCEAPLLRFLKYPGMTLVGSMKFRKDYSRLWSGQLNMPMPILLKPLFFLSDLYSMYVGEGESLLRDTFRQARLAAPSMIFFDEADAVASRRFYTIPVPFHP